MVNLLHKFVRGEMNLARPHKLSSLFAHCLCEPRSFVQANKGVEKKGAKLLSLEASAQAKAADAEAKQEARAEAKRKRQEEKQAEKAELKRSPQMPNVKGSA